MCRLSAVFQTTLTQINNPFLYFAVDFLLSSYFVLRLTEVMSGEGSSRGTGRGTSGRGRGGAGSSRGGGWRGGRGGWRGGGWRGGWRGGGGGGGGWRGRPWRGGAILGEPGSGSQQRGELICESKYVKLAKKIIINFC